jgi:hypothetical protein
LTYLEKEERKKERKKEKKSRHCQRMKRLQTFSEKHEHKKSDNSPGRTNLQRDARLFFAAWIYALNKMGSSTFEAGVGVLQTPSTYATHRLTA